MEQNSQGVTNDTIAEQKKYDGMVLRTEGLVKIYGKRTVANGVSINVRQGEIVGLLGPNGAGKTTSFYMTTGLVVPNAGKVYLNDEDITDYPVYRRARAGIGYLPQEASVFRKLSVEDNIMAVLEMTGKPRTYQLKKLESLLTEFRLNHVRKNKGDQLSGGERRRTEIARCLAIEPKFIMLDEPFAPETHHPEEVLNMVEVIAKRKDRHVVVCIDEFQQVGEFENTKSVQATLRSVWQHHHYTSYCLFGSKRHMMSKIFLDRSMPFYQFGDLMWLQKIPTSDWINYIMSHFEREGRHISEQMVSKICESVDHYPSYVQHLASIVLNHTPQGETATENVLPSSIKELISTNEALYMQQIEPLSGYQMNLLRAIVSGIHSGYNEKKVRNQFDLGSPSNMVRLRDALIERDIIYSEMRQLYITDPLLRFRDVKDEDDFDVPAIVIRSLKHNEVYQLPQRKGLDCAMLFELLNLWFDDLNDDAISSQELCEELQSLFEENPQVGFVQHLKEYCLSSKDQMMVTLFCHRLVNKEDDDIRFGDIVDLYDNKSDFYRARTELRNGEHELQIKKIVEHLCVDGLADVTRYKLTENAKRMLLGEMNVNDTSKSKIPRSQCRN